MLDLQVAWILTHPAGEITACNDVAERLFGRARRGLIGQPFASLLAGPAAAREAEVRRQLLGGLRVDPWSAACLDAVGHATPIRLEAEALRDDAGAVTAIAWTARVQAPGAGENGGTRAVDPRAADPNAPEPRFVEPRAPGGRAQGLEDEFRAWLNREPRLSQFLQTDALDGIWFRNLLSPNEVWVSPRFKATLGYADHEAPNDVGWWRERVVADDLVVAMENLRKHLDDPDCLYDQEVRYRHRNGSIVWLRCRGLALRDEAGRAIRMVGAHTNLTAHRLTDQLRATQQRLQESELRFRGVIESLPQLIWTAHPDGTIEFVNQNCLDYFGLATVEEVGAAWFDRVHPDDRELLTRSWETARREGRSYRAEARLLRHDGVYRWFVARAVPTRDAAGQIERWYGFDTDVQDSYNSQVKLRDSEQRLRIAQAGGQEGVWEWDIPTGLLHWSPELERLYGLAPGEAEGTSDGWSRRVHPDDLPMTMARLWEAVENHRPFDLEFRIFHSAGHIVWVNGRGGASYDTDGKPVRLLGVNIDITRRKLAEEALREAEERLLRVEALGQQVSEVAHAFNNTIQVILGQAQLSQQELGPDDRVAARLQAIAAASLRAQELARRLPSFGPAAEGRRPAPAAAAAVSAAPAAAAHEARVLYVDDESALIDLATQMLARYGFQVAGFTDPDRALEAFLLAPDRYDVVVTDVTMPRRTGLELARAMIAARADVPIVLVSGNLGPEAVEAARAAGIREILAKPFTGNDLAHVLRRLVPA